MAFTGNFMPTSFKIELLNGLQNFSANTFKIALYTNSATLDANTTAYTTSGEVASGGNYVTGGNTLSVTTTPTNGGSGTTAYIDFADTTWSAATITARGALIYNNSQSNSAVAVLDFGSDKTSTDGDFTVQFPAATNTTAIIRIA
jgi:hypothetical protein